MTHLSCLLPSFRRPRSVEQLLLRMLPATVRDQVRCATPDARMLPAAVGNTLGIPESEIMQHTAEKLGLPFMGRVPQMNIEQLPSALTLPLLRSRGASAVLVDGTLYRIVCCEPRWAADLPDCAHVPRSIASWSAIAHALTQSEQAYLARRRERETALKEQLHSTAAEVLQLIAEAGLRAKCEGALFFYEDGALHYQYRGSGEKLLQGTIDAAIKDALWNLLAAGCAAHGDSVHLPDSRRWTFIEREKHRTIEVQWVCADIEGSDGSAAHTTQQAENEAADGARADVTSQPTKAMPYVLIVDDNPTFLTVLQRFLERSNIRVIALGSALEAQTTLLEQNNAPAAVICDLHMPDMDGIELLKAAESIIGNRCPFIMLTSDESIDLEISALSCGATAVLSKSKDPRVLCAYVQRMLSHRSVEGEA